jgi:hypothetical protein
MSLDLIENATIITKLRGASAKTPKGRGSIWVQKRKSLKESLVKLKFATKNVRVIIGGI